MIDKSRLLAAFEGIRKAIDEGERDQLKSRFAPKPKPDVMTELGEPEPELEDAMGEEPEAMGDKLEMMAEKPKGAALSVEVEGKGEEFDPAMIQKILEALSKED